MYVILLVQKAALTILLPQVSIFKADYRGRSVPKRPLFTFFLDGGIKKNKGKLEAKALFSRTDSVCGRRT